MHHTGHNHATTPGFAYQQIILLPPITIKYKWQKKKNLKSKATKAEGSEALKICLWMWLQTYNCFLKYFLFINILK